ncbi:PREDICTED: melanoma-associated antigen B4-like [Galeopterus variegatus]|uniref:Melanoma-associated antigen B4-like n=1 Tax=Galeopterus variegatus TaxID=482537 RepID=A0ABM0RX75_GALVR|nr:PREDICTED: melanoma-associated antigen B4-like [Galeopterus variegatus]
MPRGRKSKLRAREKRRQAQSETQDLQGAQATAPEEKESPSSSSPVLGVTPPRSPAGGIPQKPQGAPHTPTAAVGVSRKRSGKGAKGKGEGRKNSSQASTSTESLQKDPLIRKAVMLVQFLMYKYKMKEPIMKVEMLKVVSKRYREHFPEILKRACGRIELVFGLDLKEVNPRNHSYTLVSKLDLSDGGSLSDCWRLPRNGLLMTLLGVIFLNGMCASEEEIWEFLNLLGVYDGKRHFIFGDARKLITQDLVKERYLEYQQVPNSDPPCYQFLWGPKAYAETSKMKVLEFLAKVNYTNPISFTHLYEEALRDEEERVQARAAAGSGTSAKASLGSRAESSSCSHP